MSRENTFPLAESRRVLLHPAPWVTLSGLVPQFLGRVHFCAATSLASCSCTSRTVVPSSGPTMVLSETRGAWSAALWLSWVIRGSIWCPVRLGASGAHSLTRLGYLPSNPSSQPNWKTQQ